MKEDISRLGISIEDKAEDEISKGGNLPHHPKTPALKLVPLLSAATLNQYNPLMGPGTESKTRTRRRRDRPVRHKEMRGFRKRA